MIPTVKGEPAMQRQLDMWFANTNSWSTFEYLLEDMHKLTLKPAALGFAEHRLADRLRMDTATRWLGKSGYKGQLEAANRAGK